LGFKRTDMKNVYRVSASILAVLSLVGGTDPVWAMGFGRPVSRAVLGETLSVTVPVRLDAAEELTDDCVAADVYFGDDKLAGSAVRTAIEPGASAQERVLRVATSSLINEPVVTVYLAAGCKAKVTRKFVAFADPPGLAMPAVTPPVVDPAPATSTSAVSDRATVRATPLASASTADAASQAAPRTRAKRAATPGDTAAAARSANGQSVAAAAARPVKDTKATDGNSRAPASVRPSERLSARVDNRGSATSGARLELDPVEADAVVSPDLAMTATMMVSGDPDSPESAARRAAAAALWAAMNASPEQLARDRQRMQELEQRLARLQQDAEGARKRVADMEARVREAEGQRLRHPVVYALGGACLLLAAGVAWLFMRQRRQQEAQQSWWQGSEMADAPETAPAATLAEPALARTSAEFMPVRTVAPEPVPAVAPEPVDALADTVVPDAAARLATVPIEPPFAAARTQPVVIKSEAQEAVREITVEELIDLEQQAEFFVVLGQDEAAIELLESHVQTTAGASPLPYLKLLEIYQRLGRRDDYARVQSAFNGRFNAYAPSWESDLQHGHSLEEYPGVVERIEALWSQPGKAMELLQMSLTRPDDSVETFDLPAYRELLFLYAVARDLSERESQDRKAVDLLAPPGSQAAVVEPPVPHVEPLMATRPVKALPEATPSLSLDLSLDDPVPSGPGAFVEEPMTHMDIDLDATGLDSHGRGAGAPSGSPAPQGGTIDFEAVDVSSLKR